VSGITLLEAENFDKWLFSIEVMGESQYQVVFVDRKDDVVLAVNERGSRERHIR